MKPGKTYLPVASITSAPGGGGIFGAEEVGHVALSGGDDFAVLDQQRHTRFVNPARRIGQHKSSKPGLGKGIFMPY
jgi:hypothetical protein